MPFSLPYSGLLFLADSAFLLSPSLENVCLSGSFYALNHPHLFEVHLDKQERCLQIPLGIFSSSATLLSRIEALMSS